MNRSLKIFIFIFIFQNISFGNERTSARGIGMARTFVVTSRGVDALGINPANLSYLDRGSYTTMSLLPIGVRIGSDFINLKVYNDYFTGDPDSLDKDGNRIIGRRLDANDKDGIFNLFPSGIAHTQYDFDAMLLGFTSIGGNYAIGFSVTERFSAGLDLPEGYLKILLNGFEEKGSEHTLNNTNYGVRWMREYNYSFAYHFAKNVSLWKFRDISVGISYKPVQGFYYAGTDHYNGSLQNKIYYNKDSVNWIDSIQIIGNIDYAQFQSSIPIDSISQFLFKPAGKGTGFDIGVSAKIISGWQFGMSITDIGSILWSKSPKYSYGKGNFTISDLGKAGQLDSLKNNFKGKTIDTTSFKRNLPTIIHLGAAIQLDESPYVNRKTFAGKLLLEGNIHIGLNDEPGNTTLPRFSVGAEYVIPSRWVDWLRIRSGMMFGGRELFSWSLGIGIVNPVFDFDIGTESIALIITPNSFRNGSVSMGLKIRM